eukprot:COSAG01_NODE_9162_length_2532_cov_2.386354_1_plen_122_part_00
MAQLLAAERAAAAAEPKEQQQQVRSDGVALWKSAQRLGSMGRQHEAAHLYREAIAKEAAASAGAGAKDGGGGGGGGGAARLGTLHYHLAHSLLAGQPSELPRALAAAERALALLPQVRGPL